MFSGKRAVILIISICFLSFLPDLSLGKHLLGKVIIYNKGKTILGESKYYRIIKIQKTSIDVEMEELEKLEKVGITPWLFDCLHLEYSPCTYESVELNYLALQDTTSKNIPDKVNYVYVDFANLRTGFITTEKTSLGKHIRGEYGLLTIEVPGLREGLNEKQHKAMLEYFGRKKEGIFDKEKWEKFFALVKPKLTCKPQKEIKTIWLSN